MRLKLSLGDRVSRAVSVLAAAEEVGEAEIIRRAVAAYLDSNMGPGWALGGPSVALLKLDQATEHTVGVETEGTPVAPGGALEGPSENERHDGTPGVDALGGTIKGEGGDPSPTSPLPPTLPLRVIPAEQDPNPKGESEGAEPYSKEFEEFWAAYPKKASKGDAWRRWQRLGKRRPPLPQILDAIEAAKRSEQWTRDGGQYIPHPASWLNGHRWLDGGAMPTAPALPRPAGPNVAVARRRAEQELFRSVPPADLEAATADLDKATTYPEINAVLDRWINRRT